MFILQRKEDKAFVQWPGERSSYTRNLMFARTFQTREDAEQDRCGNERIIAVEELLRRPR